MKSIDTIRLRLMCGWLGLLLPWAVLALYIIHGCAPEGHTFPDSISSTFYVQCTVAVFMIILGSASILLMCYRGYNKWDDLLNTITGIAGLCICIFPCYDKFFKLNYPEEFAQGVGTFQLPMKLSGTIHNVSAAVFFILLAFNVIFLFTKSKGEMTKNKKIRNIIYRVCGVGMLSAMVCLFIFNSWATVWWIEAVALMFFGIAFLTKADIYPWLFCDSPYEDKETDNA